MLNKPQKALKLNASKSKGDVSKSKWDVSKVKRNVSKNASKTKWDSLRSLKPADFGFVPFELAAPGTF